MGANRQSLVCLLAPMTHDMTPALTFLMNQVIVAIVNGHYLWVNNAKQDENWGP